MLAVAAVLGILCLTISGIVIFVILNQQKQIDLLQGNNTMRSTPSVAVVSVTPIASATAKPEMPDVTTLKDETLYYCIYQGKSVLYIHTQANGGSTWTTQDIHAVYDQNLATKDLARKDFTRCQTLLEGKSKESIYIEGFVLNTDQSKLYTVVVNDKTNTFAYPTTINVYEFDLTSGSNKVLLTKESSSPMFGYSGSFRPIEFLQNKYLILSTGPCYGCGAPMDRFFVINVETSANKLLGDKIGAFEMNADKTKIKAKEWLAVGEATECVDDCTLYEPVGPVKEFALP